MAEQIPVIQNKKLLVVALVLAALVTVLFNVYVHKARNTGQTETADLTAFSRRMKPGDKIKADDLKLVAFPKAYMGALPNVVEWVKKDIAVGTHLSDAVREGEFVRYSLLGLEEGSLPSSTIGPDMTTYTFRLDRQGGPGNLLVPNARVNVVGMFSSGNRTEAMIVIRQVRVLAVGGKGPVEMGPGMDSSGQGQASYGALTIEVPSDVALQLANIRTHAAGDFWVQLLNPKEPLPGLPKVEAQVEPLARTARPAAAHGTP